MGTKRFPSPCGELRVSDMISMGAKPVEKPFPSPCGELRVSDFQAFRQVFSQDSVSVPLRGIEGV